MKKLKVPKWITAFVAEWKELLFLHDWVIHTSMHHYLDNEVPDEQSTLAQVTIVTHSRGAHIKILSSIKNDFDGRKTLVHELLHIAHSDIDAIINEDVIQLLSDDVILTIGSSYKRAMEQFVDSMAYIVLNSVEGEIHDT